MNAESGELDSQRNSAPVANQMTLAASLSSACRIATRLLPQENGRNELPSTTALDHSICP
jgi:hypothetical protein